MAIIVSRLHAAVLSEQSAPHRHIDSSQHIDCKVIVERERERERAGNGRNCCWLVEVQHKMAEIFCVTLRTCCVYWKVLLLQLQWGMLQ